MHKSKKLEHIINQTKGIVHRKKILSFHYAIPIYAGEPVMVTKIKRQHKNRDTDIRYYVNENGKNFKAINESRYNIFLRDHTCADGCYENKLYAFANNLRHLFSVFKYITQKYQLQHTEMNMTL